MSTKIQSVSALEILDSRGNPTVMVTAELNNGIAKYNRLLAIERELGRWAVYGGRLLR